MAVLGRWRMTGVRRRTALLLGAALVALPAAASPGAWAADPVAAEPGLVSEQLVVSQLDASGLPVTSSLTTQVVARDTEYGRVLVPTSTKDLRYLDRRGAPATEGDAAVVMLGGPGQSSVLLGSSLARPLPVALHAEYRRDGVAIDPATLGGSGDVRIAYTVTNTVVSQQTVSYRDADGVAHAEERPVFAPFAGTLSVTLPTGTSVVSAPTASVSTGPTGGTVLTWDLVLYPPLGSAQQQLVVDVRSDALAVPSARMEVLPVTSVQDPSVAFSEQLLDSTVEGNISLADGLTELDANARKVAAGSLAVTEGLAQVSSGASQLADSVTTTLVPGATSLASGAAQQSAGQSSLASALGQSSTGADAVATGAAELSAGLDQIAAGLAELAGPTGLPAAQAAAEQLETSVGSIADAVGSASDPSIALPPAGTPTLVQLSRASAVAAGALRTSTAGVATALGGVVTRLASVQADATSAASSAQAVYDAACLPAPVDLTPAQCTTLAASITSATSAATGAGTASTSVGNQVTALTANVAGLTGLAAALDRLTDGLLAVSTGLRSGDPSSPGVEEGLASLVDGLTASVAAVTQLSSAAAASVTGAQQVEDGSKKLADALASESSGADELAAGGVEIASGADDLAQGASDVGTASDQLASGAATAEDGSAAVTAGATELADQGTSEVLAGVIDASREPALARAYLAATAAYAGSAAPFAAPAGGVARIAYVSEIAAEPSVTGAIDPSVVGLALLALAAVGSLAVLAVRRIRRVAADESA